MTTENESNEVNDPVIEPEAPPDNNEGAETGTGEGGESGEGNEGSGTEEGGEGTEEGEGGEGEGEEGGGAEENPPPSGGGEETPPEIPPEVDPPYLTSLFERLREVAGKYEVTVAKTNLTVGNDQVTSYETIFSITPVPSTEDEAYVTVLLREKHRTSVNSYSALPLAPNIRLDNIKIV